MTRDSIIPLRPPRIDPAAPLAPEFGSERVTLGMAEADAWLAGGLRSDALHEAYATRDDATGATALALLVAWRNHALEDKAIIWAREAAGPSLPYGPGLAELGIDPTTITLLLLPDSRAVLRTALDSVRQGAAGTVLIELRGRQPLLDLTATRRLALAAQESTTMVWLVRGDAQPTPSAAQTRWLVAHAPAAERIGDWGARPAFDLTLLRQRGGREGLQLRMEWDRDTASFHPSPAPAEQSLPGLVTAVASQRKGTARGDRAA